MLCIRQLGLDCGYDMPVSLGDTFRPSTKIVGKLIALVVRKSDPSILREIVRSSLEASESCGFADHEGRTWKVVFQAKALIAGRLNHRAARSPQGQERRWLD